MYGGRRIVAVGLYTVFISTHLVAVILSIVILHDLWGEDDLLRPSAIMRGLNSAPVANELTLRWDYVCPFNRNMYLKWDTYRRHSLLHTGITFQSPCHVRIPLTTAGIQIICEIVLVVMQLVHANRHTRQLGIIGHHVAPLLRTLYMDGFVYFVVVVTLRLWSALDVRSSSTPSISILHTHASIGFCTNC